MIKYYKIYQCELPFKEESKQIYLFDLPTQKIKEMTLEKTLENKEETIKQNQLELKINPQSFLFQIK